MFIVDAHLDLSYNALRGRDVTLPAARQMRDDEGTPTVGLPDLHAGGVGLVCATIFIEPASRNTKGGYRTVGEAHEQTVRHLRWYREQVGMRRMKWVRSVEELAACEPETDEDDAQRAPVHHAAKVRDAEHPPIPFILLMEGADALRSEADVTWWWEQGLRIVGLAWKRTLLAGGTGEPGPLTPLGRTILAALDHAGFTHDISHLAEESFWQLLEMTRGPVMASHSNSRAIIPTDRHLSDKMALALARRGGVIGINLFGRFLVPPDEYGQRPPTLADVVRQVRYFADLFGHVQQIGIGTDLDGGFGREDSPRELTTIADLPKLADELSTAGFDDRAVAGIMGGNWMRFLRRALPAG